VAAVASAFLCYQIFLFSHRSTAQQQQQQHQQPLDAQPETRY